MSPSITAEEFEEYRAYWGDHSFRTPDHCPICLTRECECPVPLEYSDVGSRTEAEIKGYENKAHRERKDIDN